MIFVTYWYPFFAALVLPVYWLVREPRVRMVFLLAACLVFHTHFAGPAGVIPIVILGIFTYLAGLSRRAWALVLVMILCAAALVLYKYTVFLAESLAGFFFAPDRANELIAAAKLNYSPALAPLAISFFAFEFVHYLFDVKKGHPSIRNPLDFMAFTFFFPTLVAGPIKRYETFLPAFHRGLKSCSRDDVAYGLMRIGIGYFKKVVIADNLTSYIELHQTLYDQHTLSMRWWIFILIGVRILMDFSGYSDIAIGFARMMGVRVGENFDWPYLSTSVQDFWRKWHISLSSWIRDYIYIPLGGSRVGLPRKILNGVIAFGLCGLWHGPAGHFIFWGVYHGLGLAVAANYVSLMGKPGQTIALFLNRFPIVSWALTMMFVFVGWLYFFYPLNVANDMLIKLFIRHPDELWHSIKVALHLTTVAQP